MTCPYIDLNGKSCTRPSFNGKSGNCCGQTHRVHWEALKPEDRASRIQAAQQRAMQAAGPALGASSVDCLRGASSGDLLYNSSIPPVRFYDQFTRNSEFGNFHESPIVDGGNKYPCAEADFQRKRFLDPNIQKLFTTEGLQAYIRSKCLDPVFMSNIKPRTTDQLGEAAFQRARELKNQKVVAQDPGWISGGNVIAMTGTLKKKYDQNPALRAKLMATGDAQLIEDSKRDSFWGVGPDGKGQNMLGTLLMELRRDYRREERTGFSASAVAAPVAAPVGMATARDAIFFSCYSRSFQGEDGKLYPCVEAYVQSRKFLTEKIRNLFTEQGLTQYIQERERLNLPEDQNFLVKVKGRRDGQFGEAAMHLALKLIRDGEQKDPQWIKGGLNVQVMEKALELQFDQHPDLKRQLIETGNDRLRVSSQDPFWGVGSNGEGQNKLGELLMGMREKYRLAASAPVALGLSSSASVAVGPPVVSVARAAVGQPVISVASAAVGPSVVSDARAAVGQPVISVASAAVGPSVVSDARAAVGQPVVSVASAAVAQPVSSTSSFFDSPVFWGVVTIGIIALLANLPRARK